VLVGKLKKKNTAWKT